MPNAHVIVRRLTAYSRFNSSFFASIASMNYSVVFATPGFLEGDSFDYTDSSDNYVQSGKPSENQIAQVQEQVVTNPSQFERLESAECIQRYATDLITDRRSVIVITNDVPVPDRGSVLTAIAGFTATPNINGYDWICPLSYTLTTVDGVTQYSRTYSYFGDCSQQIAQGQLDLENWTPTNITAEYCLSQKVEEQCGFHANIAIIWTVVVCNMVKILIMVYIACSRGLETPLLTIGDSVASFMTNPDPTTVNLGPITIRAVKALGRDKTSDRSKVWSADRSSGWQPSSRLRWFHAVSVQRWCFTII